MTTNLTTRNGQKMTLSGNSLSGDTFAVKGYIKAYLAGKWDANTKSWTIDTNKLAALLDSANSIGLKIDTPVDAQAPDLRDAWTVNTKHGRELAADY